MLLSLTLKNFVLIDEVTIPFGEGFHVLTGETGAGKTLLVQAIQLLTGQKVSSDMIRQGEEKAILEASYIADQMNTTDGNLICHCRWTGIAGRELVFRGDPYPHLSRHYTTAQSSYELTETIALSALPDALPEIVFAILSPLYELFDFFQLSKRLVEQELASLQGSQF